jgi:hypothetical protein
MRTPDPNREDLTGGGIETKVIATALFANGYHTTRPVGIGKGNAFGRLNLVFQLKEATPCAVLLVPFDDCEIILRMLTY